MKLNLSVESFDLFDLFFLVKLRQVVMSEDFLNRESFRRVELE